MTKPKTNKTKARWQLGMILFFEAVISVAAIWVGFMTKNWAPTIAVLVCGGIVTVLMAYAVLNSERDDAAG